VYIVCVYIHINIDRYGEPGAREAGEGGDGDTAVPVKMKKASALAINLSSADGSTHTESNKLYRKVKHRYRPNLSPRQRPTAESRHDQAALAASAEARGATHRARPRSPILCMYA